MSLERKKISLDRFQLYPRQVISLVNRRNVEVIVYNADGPVARLLPYAAGPVGIVKKKDVRPMDMGGVWYIDESLRERLAGSPRRRRFAGLSLNAVWKLARVSAILPFFTRV